MRSSLQAMAEHLPGATAEAWAKAGAHWHARILPKHFRPGAEKEYGYGGRTPAYMRKKQRKHGHQRPLVFSGVLERDVLRVRDVRPVRSVGVRVVLHGPKYLFSGSRRTGSDRARAAAQAINYQTELGAVSESDAQEIARVLGGELVSELSKPMSLQEVQ